MRPRLDTNKRLYRLPCTEQNLSLRLPSPVQVPALVLERPVQTGPRTLGATNHRVQGLMILGDFASISMPSSFLLLGMRP
jgi:hypothetical protein